MRTKKQIRFLQKPSNELVSILDSAGECAISKVISLRLLLANFSSGRGHFFFNISPPLLLQRYNILVTEKNHLPYN